MKVNFKSCVTKGFIFSFGISVLVGCQNKGSSEIGANLIVAGDPKTERSIGDDKQRFVVLGNQTVVEKIEASQVFLLGSTEANQLLKKLAGTRAVLDGTAPTSDPLAKNNSLILGYPLDLLNEHQVFGGVITKVTDKQNENLGSLKLSDLTPVHVRTEVVSTGTNQYALALMGCASNCSEASAESPLIGFPIVGVDQNKQLLLLDLSTIGGDLNLIKIMDPDGSYTQLKTKASKTSAFDFSVSTLVFDVETDMIPLSADPNDSKAPVTTFTVRWYLRLASAFNPAFQARDSTSGVGFFMTERSIAPKIERHSLPGPIKYFVKNVPSQYQAAFASSFDEWNDTFTKLTGQKLLSYEFIDENDARSAALVAGDVRYKILEWDLINKASYGGLGPSIANQFTGEILSSNVLIQGPTIIEIYSKWFGVAQLANAMREAGMQNQADLTMLRNAREMRAQLEKLKGPQFDLKLGRFLNFRIAAQLPSLEDPMLPRQDFDQVPQGVTFDQYMSGYFHDMVTHELGHNLGLRHNFRGSLYGANPTQEGGVSISVMEYLGRRFRYLDHEGTYDNMALQYGYLGMKPTVLGRFCTDENVPTKDLLGNSAECSRDDATVDSFSYFQQRLAQAINHLIERGQTTAPTWMVGDMTSDLTATIQGLALYGATAAKTATSWTNFFIGGDRPVSVDGVVPYVLQKIKAQLCDPTFDDVVKGKESDDAKAKTLANIAALQDKATTLIVPLKVYTADDLKCAH